MARCLAALIVTLVSLTAGAAPASAEWFADVYTRGSFTQRADITTDAPDLGQRTTLHDVKFDRSLPTVGGRVGYWLESVPVFGLAVDAFRFRPDVGRQTRTARICAPDCVAGDAVFQHLDLSVIGLSPQLMFRAPGMLATDTIPSGRLQPYFTLGPAVFIAQADDTTNFASPAGQSDTDVSVGVQIGWGMAWQFHRHWAIFAEYRFTHVSPAFEFTSSGATTTVKANLDTHHAVGGISFRF